MAQHPQSQLISDAVEFESGVGVMSCSGGVTYPSVPRERKADWAILSRAG